jgi:hypothetical protein
MSPLDRKQNLRTAPSKPTIAEQRVETDLASVGVSMTRKSLRLLSRRRLEEFYWSLLQRVLANIVGKHFYGPEWPRKALPSKRPSRGRRPSSHL